MEWIVKIEETPDVENEKDQRIRILFDPLAEQVHFFGEAKVRNNKWYVFTQKTHGMKITLEELQARMELVVVEMRKRLVEYENLNKGFSVLKWIAFEEENEIIGD
jgi:hypothetical protein